MRYSPTAFIALSTKSMKKRDASLFSASGTRTAIRRRSADSRRRRIAGPRLFLRGGAFAAGGSPGVTGAGEGFAAGAVEQQVEVRGDQPEAFARSAQEGLLRSGKTVGSMGGSGHFRQPRACFRGIGGLRKIELAGGSSGEQPIDLLL